MTMKVTDKLAEKSLHYLLFFKSTVSQAESIPMGWYMCVGKVYILIPYMYMLIRPRNPSF